MKEAPQPDESPIIDPNRLLGESFHDKNFQKVILLIDTKTIKMDWTLAQLEELPFCQKLPPDQWDVIFERLNATTLVLPTVEKLFGDFFETNSSTCKNPLRAIDFLLRSKDIPAQLHLPRREYMIAVANIGFRTLASIFKITPEKEKKDILAALVYLGTIHELLIGIKTNIYFFLAQPEQTDLSIIKKIAVPVFGFEQKELISKAAEHLVEGGRTSPLMSFGPPDKQQKFVILY